MNVGLARYVSTMVRTKTDLPSDRRGVRIPPNTVLFVSGMAGSVHFNLDWPGSKRRAASQIHFSKLTIAEKTI